jgi:coenzyme F420-0:L-glutamate ligase/coenzyme F420-1:gamma-L-glutamate ligase
MTVQVRPVRGIPEVRPGDDVADLITTALSAAGEKLVDGDIVAVASKILSKSDALVAPSIGVEVTEAVRELAGVTGFPPEDVALILAESTDVLRAARGVIVTETRHGYVCANAGIDRSNSVAEGAPLLLPLDCDGWAATLREHLEARHGVRLAVIVTDTFGRPFRNGQVNVALGVAGLKPIRDYRGLTDHQGYLLKGTEIAIADELASAAELVMNKLDQVPVAVIRGYDYEASDDATGRALLRPAREDVFR